jgi:uracil-DNA glycosylase family 4
MRPLMRLHETMRSCTLCLEAGYAVVPGAIFSGNSSARVMVIGQAPGTTEVDARRPFNAGSGRRLFEWLGAAGWSEETFRRRHYMTAVTKCYPGKSPNGRGDRVPSLQEQALCRPYLQQELSLVNPILVVPVGGLAIGLFFGAGRRLDQVIGRGAYYRPEVLDTAGTGVWPGEGQELEAFDAGLPDGRWVVPLPHPSGASAWPNLPQNRALIDRALVILADIRSHFDL